MWQEGTSVDNQAREFFAAEIDRLADRLFGTALRLTLSGGRLAATSDGPAPAASRMRARSWEWSARSGTATTRRPEAAA